MMTTISVDANFTCRHRDYNFQLYLQKDTMIITISVNDECINVNDIEEIKETNKKYEYTNKRKYE